MTNSISLEHTYFRVASIDSPFREQIVWAYMITSCRPGMPNRDMNLWAKYPAIEAGASDISIPNHQAVSLSELNLERIRNTPHSGGDRRSWPSKLVLACHSNGHTGHTDVYGRMDWNKVAPTLTARCYSLSNGRYGHPIQDRAISLREAAALQSFEDDYIFFGSLASIGKQIGNAVPVKMAESLAKYILRSTQKAMLNE